MKILVVYSTKTGNTKKVAEAIAQALPGAELHDVKTAPAPDAYDFIAMGFWVDKGGPNKEAADYMKTISGKKVFTFFTLGANPDSMHARTCAEAAPKAYGEGCEQVAAFWCQGSIDPVLIEWMRKMPAGNPHAPTPEAEARWAEAAKHPDETDLQHAAQAAAENPNTNIHKESFLMKHTHLNRTKRHAGFTLIELLVVVAIIAIIGAGVAVTYRYLDERAKTAMEMNDCSTLMSTISHWSAVNDGKLINKLDSLIDTEGNMYHNMPATAEGMTLQGVTQMSSSGMGLTGPVGYTAMALDAPDEVIETLRTSGLTQVFLHRVDATNANDSTFAMTGMGGDMDVSDTLCSLTVASESEAAAAALAEANDLVSQAETLRQTLQTALEDDDLSNDSVIFTPTDGDPQTFTSLADLNTAIEEAEAVVEGGNPLTKLCFVYPGGGATMRGMTMPMNLTDEIISNCGLTNSQVADPNVDYNQNVADGKRYYLVVMGLGRFASIYSGKAIRVDTPAYGKRQEQTDTTYNRYLVVIKVPTSGYDSMTGEGEPASVATVLTPQGYTVASLRDNYINDTEKVKD